MLYITYNFVISFWTILWANIALYIVAFLGFFIIGIFATILFYLLTKEIE